MGRRENTHLFLSTFNVGIVSLQEFVMGIKEMPRLARFIPKIMLAITVTACDEVYRKIACWLNDMGENKASMHLHSDLEQEFRFSNQ